jgi:hypothetical protein
MLDKYLWLRDLAVADSSREILNYKKHFEPNMVLREESQNLLKELNSMFFEYAEVFNSNIKAKSTPLKVMGITNKQNFLVFRKNFRLVVSIYEPGVILFTFENFSGNLYSNIKESKNTLPADEVYNSGNILVGELGPFNEMTWLFEDQPVETSKVVRHYFTEFIKASADLMKNMTISSISPQGRHAPRRTV